MYEAGVRGQDKKSEVENILKEPPVLVLFFMDGCPHCEVTEKAWKDVKSKMKGKARVIEVEESAVPTDAGISGFPTIVYKSSSGEKKIEGERTSSAAIESELGLPTKGGARRSRRHRSSRKFRHRSLRNHVALVSNLTRRRTLSKKA